MVGKISEIAWKEAVRELEGKKLSSNDFWTKKIVINICNYKKLQLGFYQIQVDLGPTHVQLSKVIWETSEFM